MADAAKAEWIIGAIRIDTTEGWIRIPGWTNGLFGIDWRPCGDELGAAYVVTHTPTGWSVFAVCADLEVVQGLVDELQDRIDWSGSDIGVLRDRIWGRRAELRDFIDEHGAFDPERFWVPAGHHSVESGPQA